MLKDSSLVRIILILLCLIGGLALIFGGWTLTGQIWGLLIMFGGIILLLLALWFYNWPYKN